jgi:hypothetical protein
VRHFFIEEAFFYKKHASCRMPNYREFKQIPANLGYYITIGNTTYIYPMADIERALASTSVPHTFNGEDIVVPTIQGMNQLLYEIWYQTALSQPIGNQGYSIGVQSALQDFGKNIFFRFPNGELYVQYRLVKLLTPQTQPPDNVIPTPGNAPVDTAGFVVIWAAYMQSRPNPDLDIVTVARTG